MCHQEGSKKIAWRPSLLQDFGFSHEIRVDGGSPDPNKKSLSIKGMDGVLLGLIKLINTMKNNFLILQFPPETDHALIPNLSMEKSNVRMVF